jgi:hypothetical protein
VLKDELRQLLRELAAATGATAVSIAHSEQHTDEVPSAEEPHQAPHHLAIPVGGGAVLRASFLVAEEPPDPNGRSAALERTARALRSAARRWDVATLPPVSIPEPASSPRGLILSRIESYLRALVSTLSMDNAAVTLRGRVVATAGPLGEMHRAQIPFTVRRVAAEVDRRRGASSHADLAGDDFYALSFWYGGCFIGFFSAPYVSDFVRHRTRLVTRELAHLLSMLDEPSHDPVQTAPRPD